MSASPWMTAAVITVLAVLGVSTLGLIAVGPANVTPQLRVASTGAIFAADGAGPTCSITVASENSADNAVQGAINLYASTPGAVICLGPGTFPEQLTINGTSRLTLLGSGNTSTILEPSAVQVNQVDLDSGLPMYAIIGAHGDSDLSIQDLSVNGSLAYSSVPGCNGFLGIYYADTSGTITGTSVSDINQQNGCQSQNAIFANNGYFQTQTAVPLGLYIANNTVSNYGKNGITCNDPGLTCTISANTVGTHPMVYGLSATNGIQLYGSTGTVLGNTVTGNTYLPSGCTNNYFFGGDNACPNVAEASGILLYAPGNGVNVSGNWLAGNQLGIAEVAGPVSAWYNTIASASDYAIVFDFNSSLGWTGTPLYATGPYAGVAGDNSITNANVGILVYDDNATLEGNVLSEVNTSFEVANDLAVGYSVTLSGNVADSNVTGALLGDISAFQTGVTSYPTADFSVQGNTFVNASVGGDAPDGILLTGASATVSDNTVTGFDQAIQAVLAPRGSATVSDNDLTAPALPPAGPGVGIYVFADTATISGNNVSGWSWQNGAGWWPNSQNPGIFAQCAATCDVAHNDLSHDAIGIAVISYLYGPNPAPGWPYAADPSAGPITVHANHVTDSTAFGIALELNQGPSASTIAPSATVTNNTVDNTLSGAVGLMVDQGYYTIAGNVFSGTTLSGTSGSSQPTGEGSIGTAPIQVLNANDYATWANLSYNVFEGVTSPDLAVLNVTSGGGFAHAGFGEATEFAESGLPGGTEWYLNVTGAPKVGLTASSFIEDLPNGTIDYRAATSNPRYHAVDPSSSVTVSGGGQTVTVPFALTTYPAAFSETGLESGTSWSITINGTDTMSSTSSPITFELPNGSYSYTLSPVTDYATSSYSGSFVIDGSGYSTSFAFVLQEYTVAFTESGLPGGTSWSVTLGSQTLSSTGTTIDFQEVNGTYGYTLGAVAGYTTSSYTGSVTVNGGGQSVSVDWSPFTYSVQFKESGLASGTSWSVTTDSSTQTSTTPTIDYSLANGTYGYTIGSVPDYAVTETGSYTVNGGTVTVLVTFVLQQYQVWFHEKYLPSGTSWSVTLNGVTETSTTKNIYFEEVNGTYSYSVGTIAGWHLESGVYSGSITVSGTPVKLVEKWAKTTYKVIFIETGLPHGDSWQVKVGANTISSTTDEIIFHLGNKSSYNFQVTGPAGYTAAPASGSFSINGAGLTKSITFS